MAPVGQKRKSTAKQEESTDDENSDKGKITAYVSKRGRQVNPAATSETKKNELKFDLEWSDHGEANKGVRPLLYLWSKTVPGSTKVAAFDIDHTVIKTKSGRQFATGKFYLFNFR
jgi:hypothetical protein